MEPKYNPLYREGRPSIRSGTHDDNAQRYIKARGLNKGKAGEMSKRVRKDADTAIEATDAYEHLGKIVSGSKEGKARAQSRLRTELREQYGPGERKV